MELKIWEMDTKRIENLINKFNIDEKLARFFVGRGISDRMITKLLDKDIQLLPHNNIINIDIASNKIYEYINNSNAKIYIYADYDADGINSGYIANDCLTQLINIYNTGCEVELKMPNRKDGYGLSLDWCKKIAKKNLREKKDVLVITVDNGITKKVESDFLISNNIDVIITDHHSPKANEVPDTDKCIVIDPHLYKESANARGLCGAAIAYKLFSYLLDVVYQDTSGYSSLYLVNAAIATITDMMPHTEENLAIVTNGLRLFNDNYCCDSLSYYKNLKKKTIKPKDIGFELGPQLNACGRMGDIDLAIEYLTSDESSSNKSYKKMEKLNEERKNKEKDLLKSIFSKDYSMNNMIIALVPELGGLGGTIASKIVNKYNKPVIVISDTEDTIVHGSARNIGNIDLHHLFTNEVVKGNMINFGGHKAASGVEIDKTKLKDLQDSLDKQLQDLYDACDSIQDVDAIDEFWVDDIIGLASISKTTLKPFEDIMFFGDLKEPMYAIKDVTILNERRSANVENICFNMVDETFGAMKIKDKEVGKEIWMWGFGSKYEAMGSPSKVHLIGQIVPDFRNEKVYTFDIIDMIKA